MRSRTCAALVAAVVPLALPVAGASAATTPPAAAPSPAPRPVFTFIPPKVGPITVTIGATYIGGKLISAGVNTGTPGVSLPPIVWSPPA